MKGWGGLILALLAGAAGMGLKGLGIEPHPSPAWFWAYAIMFGLVASFSLNKAQDDWPLEGGPLDFAVVENLVIGGATATAALVMMGLAGVGGFVK